MLKIFVAGLGILSLAACAQKSAYEAAVEDLEPRYCYQSLAGVTCYETPYHRDEKRLVNYFGPAPKRYDKPAVPPKPVYDAPEAVNYWVKDPEPIPTPAATGDLADRPWLTKKHAVEATPSADPVSYRVRRDGATYIIKEVPAAAPEEPERDTQADPEKLDQTADSGTF
ncbi:MAG: hypothetical protein HQ483_03285 [Rhodospirillales bacterium]|nr:hypothetical protein [Rhodospirillales bacterium]